ncbi:MAG TPA: LysR family transcriptional regulator [Burkholderiales bacterium]|nr:LysR family transcriptional regulator [Burkholderiales bacterium]
MDITLARTFLEIVDCGNFVRAAERLHVTQTAVSVRVQSLESQLGRKLFIRNKAGATLTPAGEQFLRYAPLLIQVWERARQQVAVPPGLRAVVAVGAELTLWSPFLLDWLVWTRRSAPQLALRTQVGLPEGLMNQVSEGLLDIAVLYAPQHRPGLKVELLMQEKLVLVTTAKQKAAQSTAADYVYVDWGPDFAAHHNLTYPELSNPGTYVGLGPLGLQYILRVGGSGYFRTHAVAPYVRSGRLRVVRGAPEYMYPAYAVYSEGADLKVMAPALAGLRHIAKTQAAPSFAKAKRRRGGARRPA